MSKKVSKKKDPSPVVLMSGHLKTLTPRQLNYASASRSTDSEQGDNNTKLRKRSSLWQKYPGPPS